MLFRLSHCSWTHQLTSILKTGETKICPVKAVCITHNHRKMCVELNSDWTFFFRLNSCELKSFLNRKIYDKRYQPSHAMWRKNVCGVLFCGLAILLCVFCGSSFCELGRPNVLGGNSFLRFSVTRVKMGQQPSTSIWFFMRVHRNTG